MTDILRSKPIFVNSLQKIEENVASVEKNYE
jgi:hypothetical protein